MHHFLLPLSRLAYCYYTMNLLWFQAIFRRCRSCMFVVWKWYLPFKLPADNFVCQWGEHSWRLRDSFAFLPLAKIEVRLGQALGGKAPPEPCIQIIRVPSCNQTKTPIRLDGGFVWWRLRDSFAFLLLAKIEVRLGQALGGNNPPDCCI